MKIKYQTMKSIKRGLLIFLMGVLFLSCQQLVNDVKHSNFSDKKFLPNYKEPKFVNDLRIQKVISIERDLKTLFKAHARDKNIPGIAYGVIVDDSLVVKSSIGFSQIENKVPVSTSTSFRIASLTKSFTAMAIIKLRDEGKLSLSDPISKYVPEIKSMKYLTEDSPVINIENLLSMPAGFPEDNAWGDRQLQIETKDFLRIISEGLSMSKVPSTEYEYSNTGYSILGHIISKVSKTSYQNYISENILIPLGMTKTYWEFTKVPKDNLASGYRWEDESWKNESLLHDGAFGAMAGLITSIDDYSKYVSFLLSAWPARSGEDDGPIERSSLREMQTPQYNFLNSWNSDWNNNPCASMIGYGYGLGISMDCKRIKRVSHSGSLPGFGSYFSFYPEYGIGVVAFGNVYKTRPIPIDQIEKILFERLGVQSRKLPASDILEKRKSEIVNLIEKGYISQDESVFAENFFLDKSMDRRTKEFEMILEKAGKVENIGDVYGRNQLRGDFILKCANGNIRIFFTLTPENTARIQQLDISYRP